MNTYCMRSRALAIVFLVLTACIIQVDIDAPVELDVELPSIECDAGVSDAGVGDAGCIIDE